MFDYSSPEWLKLCNRMVSVLGGDEKAARWFDSGNMGLPFASPGIAMTPRQAVERGNVAAVYRLLDNIANHGSVFAEGAA